MATFKWTIVPKPIDLNAGKTPPKDMEPEKVEALLKRGQLGLSHLVDFLTKSDSRFLDNGAGLRSGARLRANFNGCEEGDAIKNLPADLKLLHVVAEKPQHGYPTKFVDDGAGGMEVQLGEDLISLLDAIAESVDADPKDQEAEAPPPPN